jgi:hypothetical protein
MISALIVRCTASDDRDDRDDPDEPTSSPNVTMTQNFYAHVAPAAWEQAYHRVSFVVPSTGTIYVLTKRKPKKVEDVVIPIREDAA